MANQLKMATADTIVSLAQLGWSQRRIARELGVDRETVARYIQTRGAGPKPSLCVGFATQKLFILSRP
ncbi:MAG: helix-turn-helix domain-containing protein [Phycisphaerae bacterium]|nr:helix-turn-helix domain-containing protein [Phycisphaerae bacterium]